MELRSHWSFQFREPKKSQKFRDAAKIPIKWRAPVDEDGHYSFAVPL
jgi:hypothetical protein